MDLVYQPINTQDPMMLKNLSQDMLQVSTIFYFKNQTRIMYKSFQLQALIKGKTQNEILSQK